MSTATFLTNNKTTQNCFSTSILRECLNFWTTFTEILQLKKVCFYDHYFSKIIIGILDYYRVKEEIFLTIDMLVYEFSTYVVVKFISLVVTFK